MTSHSSKIILLAARDDGLLITIDGVSHLKEMNTRRYFELAREFQEAGLAILRREEHGRSNKTGDATK